MSMNSSRTPNVQVVCELIGGLNPAKAFILKALNAGKHVVTANKMLLAHYGPELTQAAVANGVELRFEAAVAGGIPIIKALREGLAANNIEFIYGILNGTCNYILSRMTYEGLEFDSALAQAINPQPPPPPPPRPSPRTPPPPPRSRHRRPRHRAQMPDPGLPVLRYRGRPR